MAGPVGRCKFTLDPEEAGVDLDDLDERFDLDDLNDWYSFTSAVCCWREPWEEADTNQCIWHAELAGKSATNLSAPPTRPERLDGAVLRDAELGDALGFADCLVPYADLSEADFEKGDLSGANLRNTDLSGANLRNTDLSGANLRTADLSGANLRNTDLSEADLEKGDLSGANLRTADLSGANLRTADLSEADLKNADLSGANLWDADLSEADFEKGDLSGANLRNTDLSEADLRNTDLSGANLRNTDLSEADLRNTDLSEADLENADLSETDPRRADLSETDLKDADLSEADLKDADLSEADLKDADLSEADLRYVDLSEADLGGTLLARVVLGNTILSSVRISQQTRFTRKHLTQIRPTFGPSFRQIGFNPDAWNAHARDSHTLAAKCSDEGLIRKARTLTVWDRRARRNEALSAGKFMTAVGSWLNWQATGHGISVRRVGRNMLTLFVVSTVIYLLFGIRTADKAIPIDVLLSGQFLTANVVDIIYFSVVTFTTSPPYSVSVRVSQWAAMVETFLGTLLIVLFGYVLGNREQV